MGELTAEKARELELELCQLRQVVRDIASAGRTLLACMPVSHQVPLALAQGPLLTLTGMAESVLPSQSV